MSATPSLRRNAGFVRLWAGYTIARVGSQITILALPLTAVLVLGAGATATGLLVAARTAPSFIALFIGVWVDRSARRPILIAADLGNALVIGSVPVAAALGILSLPQLYVVALLSGFLFVVTDLARRAFLPALVGRAELAGANSRLQGSEAVAQVSGPSLGGALVQALTAPIAMAVDAVSFLVSAAFISRVRAVEAVPPRALRRGVRHEIGEGLRFVRRQEVLLRAYTAIALANVEWFAVQALLVVYATNELHLSPALLGFALAASGPFSVVGAAVAGPFAARWGIGRMIVAALACEAASRLLLPFAAGPPVQAAAVIALTQALVGLTVPLLSVGYRTLEQSVTPDRLLGRVGSASSFIQFTVAPPAALGAGLLGDAIGLRPTLFLAGVIAVIAVAYLLASPLRSFRALPSAEAFPMER